MQTFLAGLSTCAKLGYVRFERRKLESPNVLSSRFDFTKKEACGFYDFQRLLGYLQYLYTMLLSLRHMAVEVHNEGGTTVGKKFMQLQSCLTEQ